MARTKKTKSIDGPTKKKGDVNLSLKDDDSFVVKHIDKESIEDETAHEIVEQSTIVKKEPEAVEKVKVSFDNFVKLVANHNFEDVIDKNKEEEVIVSSNLLADLANAHEQEEERRIPAIFIIGVLLGIVITYILLTY